MGGSSITPSRWSDQPASVWPEAAGGASAVAQKAIMRQVLPPLDLRRKSPLSWRQPLASI